MVTQQGQGPIPCVVSLEQRMLGTPAAPTARPLPGPRREVPMTPPQRREAREAYRAYPTRAVQRARVPDWSATLCGTPMTLESESESREPLSASALQRGVAHGIIKPTSAFPAMFQEHRDATALAATRTHSSQHDRPVGARRFSRMVRPHGGASPSACTEVVLVSPCVCE